MEPFAPVTSANTPTQPVSPTPTPASSRWGDPALPPTTGSNAKDKLRGFEDANLGKDAVRIHGHVERGYGSPFKMLSPEKLAEYAALEKLVEAEQKVDDANVALSAAKTAHDDALAALAVASKAVTKAAEPKPDPSRPAPMADYPGRSATIDPTPTPPKPLFSTPTPPPEPVHTGNL